jgi:hypothetical protein
MFAAVFRTILDVLYTKYQYDEGDDDNDEDTEEKEE